MTEEAEHGPDVAQLLAQEHSEVTRALASLMQMADSTSFRDQIESIAARLSKHETAEEIAVYPVLVQLEGGSDLRRRALQQERNAKITLKKILRREFWWPRGKRLRRLLQHLGDQLQEHAKFEEQKIFPLLEQSEGIQKLQMMGAWVENAESIAPTRPHPHAPQRLPGLLIIGPMLAVTDRFRDLARRTIERPPQ